MKKWKEICVVMVATVMTIFFTGGMMGLYNVRDTGFKANAETLMYKEEINNIDGNWDYNHVDIFGDACIYYELIEESYWDDSIGAPVYDSYIVITGLSMNLSVTIVTMYGITNVPQAKNISFSIPSNIKGVPVKEINDVDVKCSISGGGYDSISSIEINVPKTVTKISSLSVGNFTYSNKVILNVYPKSTEIGKIVNSGRTNYLDITCAELFDMFPSIGIENGEFSCSDGSFESYYDGRFDGTCAEWTAICPKNMEELSVTCSDGVCVVGPPVPTDISYIFNKETRTAIFIGNTTYYTASVEIPSEAYGYTVNAIASDALVGYANLTSVTVPDTVTKIGDHAIGYWKNSDGSYSRMSKVVIYCTEGSVAEAYAIENGFSYYIQKEVTTTTTTTTTTTKATTTTTTTKPATTTEKTTTTSTTKGTTIEVVPGDLNGNGKMNMVDLIQMNKYLLGQDTLSSTGYAAADVTGDGKVNIFDLALMKQMLLEK